MSDEELEVLITIDDPWYGPDEDIFNHLQPFTYWPDQSFSVSTSVSLPVLTQSKCNSDF